MLSKHLASELHYVLAIWSRELTWQLAGNGSQKVWRTGVFHDIQSNPDWCLLPHRQRRFCDVQCLQAAAGARGFAYKASKRLIFHLRITELSYTKLFSEKWPRKLLGIARKKVLGALFFMVIGGPTFAPVEVCYLSGSALRFLWWKTDRFAAQI